MTLGRSCALVCAVAAGAGCRGEARETERAATVLDGGAATAPAPSSEWWCGAVKQPVRIEPRPRLGGAGQPVRVGLVADSKEALPPTLANLERFAAVFSKERAHAVIALGGLGSTEEEIARVLGALRGAGAPVFALPGDREPEGAFHAAVARARKAGLDVTDLADVRAVAGDGLQLLSLPGYRFPSYLGARGTGCRYRPADVDALALLAAALDERGTTVPRLVVAHTPPRGAGPLALDWALGGANIGDPELARALPRLGARAAAFAHVDEAGGRAQDGALAVGENAWVEHLYLNVGAADSVPHELDSGGLGRGQAALVELSDGKARFRVLR